MIIKLNVDQYLGARNQPTDNLMEALSFHCHRKARKTAHVLRNGAWPEATVICKPLLVTVTPTDTDLQAWLDIKSRISGAGSMEAAGISPHEAESAARSGATDDEILEAIESSYRESGELGILPDWVPFSRASDAGMIELLDHGEGSFNHTSSRRVQNYAEIRPHLRKAEDGIIGSVIQLSEDLWVGRDGSTTSDVSCALFFSGYFAEDEKGICHHWQRVLDRWRDRGWEAKLQNAYMPIAQEKSSEDGDDQ
jgi:hypothetical protein